MSGYAGFLPSVLTYDHYRIMALFKDPNVLGPFLVAAVIILLDDIWEKRLFPGPIWLHISLIIMNLLGIIGTFSRGGWVNLLVCLVVYLALNINKIQIKNLNIKKITIYALLVVMIVSMIWSFVIGEEYKQFLYARINLQSYDKDRFAIQRQGVTLAFTNTLGYGPGQFEYNVLRQTGEIFSAHNLYIRLAMENGVIGFIVFIGGIILIFYRLLLDYKQGRTYLAMTPACFIAILSGILVNSLVIDTLHWRHFWFFIGLSMANSVVGVKEEIEDKSINRLESSYALQRYMEWYSRRQRQ